MLSARPAGRDRSTALWKDESSDVGRSLDAPQGPWVTLSGFFVQGVGETPKSPPLVWYRKGCFIVSYWKPPRRFVTTWSSVNLRWLKGPALVESLIRRSIVVTPLTVRSGVPADKLIERFGYFATFKHPQHLSHRHVSATRQLTGP